MSHTSGSMNVFFKIVLIFNSRITCAHTYIHIHRHTCIHAHTHMLTYLCRHSYWHMKWGHCWLQNKDGRVDIHHMSPAPVTLLFESLTSIHKPWLWPGFLRACRMTWLWPEIYLQLVVSKISPQSHGISIYLLFRYFSVSLNNDFWFYENNDISYRLFGLSLDIWKLSLGTVLIPF